MIEVARRTAWVVVADGDAPAPLVISIFQPVEVDTDEFRAVAHVRCEHFDQELSNVGLDAVQALTGLFLTTYGYLCGRRRYGFEVYWTERGDLDHPSFWGINMIPDERR